MTTLPTLTALPPPPQKPMRQKEFDEKADAFLLSLRTLGTETNIFVSKMNILAGEVTAARDTAVDKAAASAASAQAAAHSETLALQYKNSANTDRIATVAARNEMFALYGILWPTLEAIDGYLWIEYLPTHIRTVELQADGYIYIEGV